MAHSGQTVGTWIVKEGLLRPSNSDLQSKVIARIDRNTISRALTHDMLAGSAKFSAIPIQLLIL